MIIFLHFIETLIDGEIVNLIKFSCHGRCDGEHEAMLTDCKSASWSSLSGQSDLLK